jgi:hypothetical protein
LSAVSRLSLQEGETDMTNTPRNLMTGLAFTVIFGSASHAFTAQDGPVTIVVHVDNYARVSPADRSAAAAEVTRIYATAGVNTVWAPGDDHADVPGMRVRVQLLSRDMAMRKIKRERLADAVAGQAAREARYAYIFTHRILNLAVRQGEDFRRALGRVIAHEVGHLLLPVYSHADRGIMRASTFVRSNGSYDFTIEQGVAIRSMVLAASGLRAAEIANVGP